MGLKARVLDACCGSRMFWFDRQHPDTIFVDNRAERHALRDKSSAGGSRSLIVDPDMVADFTALPFSDDTFALVAFDPPHLTGAGRNGWLAKKYGVLGKNWRDDLRAGFAECFRVLRPDGVLVFKWNEEDIRISEILSLTPVKPLFGNRCGKTAKSHWIVFMKGASNDPPHLHPHRHIRPPRCRADHGGCGMISPSDVRRIRRWRHRQMIRRAIPYLNSAMAMIAIAVVFFIAVGRL